MDSYSNDEANSERHRTVAASAPASHHHPLPAGQPPSYAEQRYIASAEPGTVPCYEPAAADSTFLGPPPYDMYDGQRYCVDGSRFGEPHGQRSSYDTEAAAVAAAAKRAEARSYKHNEYLEVDGNEESVCLQQQQQQHQLLLLQQAQQQCHKQCPGKDYLKGRDAAAATAVIRDPRYNFQVAEYETTAAEPMSPSSYESLAYLACFVIWCCCWPLGCLSFYWAKRAKDKAKNCEHDKASALAQKSMVAAGVGVVVGSVVLVVCIIRQFK